jgi:hypothetical protein
MRMQLGMLPLVIAITLPHQAALTTGPAQRIAPLLHDRLDDLDLIALSGRLGSRMQRLQNVARARVVIDARAAGLAAPARAADG